MPSSGFEPLPYEPNTYEGSLYQERANIQQRPLNLRMSQKAIANRRNAQLEQWRAEAQQANRIANNRPSIPNSTPNTPTSEPLRLRISDQFQSRNRQTWIDNYNRYNGDSPVTTNPTQPSSPRPRANPSRVNPNAASGSAPSIQLETPSRPVQINNSIPRSLGRLAPVLRVAEGAGMALTVAQEARNLSESIPALARATYTQGYEAAQGNRSPISTALSGAVSPTTLVGVTVGAIANAWEKLNPFDNSNRDSSDGILPDELEDGVKPIGNTESDGGSNINGNETQYGQPPFTGGQSVGVNYNVTVHKHRQRADAWDWNPAINDYNQKIWNDQDYFSTVIVRGPINGLITINSQIYVDGQNDVATGLGPAGGEDPRFYRDSWIKITNVVRTDGQPDTGGNILGPVTTPQSAPLERPAPSRPVTTPIRPNLGIDVPPEMILPSIPSVQPEVESPSTPEWDNHPENPRANIPEASNKELPNPDQVGDPNNIPKGDPSNVPNNLGQTGSGVSASSSPNNLPEDINNQLEDFPIGTEVELDDGTRITRTEEGVEISQPLDSKWAVDPVKLGLGILGVGGAIAIGTKVVPKIAQNITGDMTGTQASSRRYIPPTPPTVQNPPNCGCNAPLSKQMNNQHKELMDKLNALTGLGGEAASTAAIMAKLNAMQLFAEKAWKATHMDKVINLLTLIAALHNVSMLSRDVAETLGYTLSQALDVVGIDKEDGSPLDVNSIVGGSITNFIKSILGEDVYNEVREQYQKANRLVQSTSMIIFSVRSIFDAQNEMLEWIGSNTGKIGNALKAHGVIGFNAFPWMSTSARPQDKWSRTVNRMRDGLEVVDDKVSSFNTATSLVLETQQEFTELQENKQRFQEALADAVPGEAIENVPIKTANEEAFANSQSPGVSPSDLIKGDSIE